MITLTWRQSERAQITIRTELTNKTSSQIQLPLNFTPPLSCAAVKEESPDSVATLTGDDVVARETEPQEGGTRAWLTVVGSALVYFASFGFMNSFGYFQDFYQANYLSNYPPSTIAFIGTLQLSLMYIMGSVAGSLFDSYGLKVILPYNELETSLIGYSGCIRSEL